MDDARIHRELQLGNNIRFEKSELYRRVFELAEQRNRRPLARALVPRITLESPKISRKLTTDGMATSWRESPYGCLPLAGGLFPRRHTRQKPTSR